LTVQELATRTGLHPNTVRFHLDILVREGQVDQVSAAPRGPGRPSTRYRAVRRMDPNGPSRVDLLATALAEHLVRDSPDPAAVATDIGRRWGAGLLGPSASPRSGVDRGEAVTAVTSVLADLGFVPEADGAQDGDTVRLRHCPFLSVVEADLRAVVCPLHMGLMRGAFEAIGAPVTVDRMEPFREPDLCVAHLAPLAAVGQEVVR